MQLALLAPYNNLAGSVTAALLPTLCAPKIHQQDMATSTLGFRNDPSSRILESESIPILEEGIQNLNNFDHCYVGVIFGA